MDLRKVTPHSISYFIIWLPFIEILFYKRFLSDLALFCQHQKSKCVRKALDGASEEAGIYEALYTSTCDLDNLPNRVYSDIYWYS